MSDRPNIPIYYTGPWVSLPGMPPCATCVMLYMGTINNEPEFQAWVIEKHKAAAASGAEFVQIDLPEREELQILPSVTVAPSLFFPQLPMPVCWTHIMGYRFTTPEERKPGQPIQLIPGKVFRPRQET